MKYHREKKRFSDHKEVKTCDWIRIKTRHKGRNVERVIHEKKEENKGKRKIKIKK